MNAEEVKKEIRDVVDFPIKGIVFRDLTTAFKNPECMRFFENEMYELYKDKGITKVVGIEKGKLPAETIDMSYAKEYGEDTIQIHKDALDADDIVLLHDDLLATGGTMKAACDLVKKFGVKKIYVNFLVELDDLYGRDVFESGIEVSSLLHY